MDAARAIKQYLESREDKSASFKQIRDQHTLKKLWKSPTDLTRIAIDFLVAREIIERVEEIDPVLGTRLDLPEDKRVYRLLT